MTIKEISNISGLTQDALRYYEKKQLIGPIVKNSSGIRNYSKKDLQRINFIKCMRRAEIPIEVLRKYMMLYVQGDDTSMMRKKILEDQRKILKKK